MFRVHPLIPVSMNITLRATVTLPVIHYLNDLDDALNHLQTPTLCDAFYGHFADNPSALGLTNNYFTQSCILLST